MKNLAFIRRFSQEVSNNRRSINNFKWFMPFQTRFLDNDRFGHMNNAVYHGIYDSVINIFLLRHLGIDLDLSKSSRIGFMVTNQCEFFAPLKYPDLCLVGLSVSKIGKTSLNYQLGMFPMLDPNSKINANMTHGYFQHEIGQLMDNFSPSASCLGHSIHVFVDPNCDNKPTPIPEDWRRMLKESLLT